MVAIQFKQTGIELQDGETVLDALLREGVSVPYSCRSGTCQTCLMRAVAGSPPPEAQKGLKNTRQAQNYFLACVCRPAMDLEIILPEDLPVPIRAVVRHLKALALDILDVALETEESMAYRPGQFVNVLSPEGLSRSYSLASVPGEDDYLHLHVRRLPNGRVSGWIHAELRVGDVIELRGPLGDCFYLAEQSSQPLLLIGTGSGLAPLYGIARDALRHGHEGQMQLFHGSREASGLYLQNELLDLSRRYPQFDYVPCLSGQVIPEGHVQGRAHEVALSRMLQLNGWRVFLCGHPDMVQQARMMAYLAGAALNEIHVDPFGTDSAQAQP